MNKGGKISLKSLRFEATPKNKYNSKRSPFNFKASPENGLVYNPPSSIMSPAIRTPRAFLPPHDPRLRLQDNFKTYTKEELEDYPVIYGYSKEKSYNITPEIASQIVQLRKENPNDWTISKLAKKFGIDQQKVNVITGSNEERQQYVKQELNNLKQSWHGLKRDSREDRKKRVAMWLRNEY